MQKIRKESKSIALSSLDRFKEEIEKRAKEIYTRRIETGKQGDAISDWLLAEEEIKAKRQIK